MNAESASISASVRVVSIAVTLELSTQAARVGDKVRAQATVTNVGTSRVGSLVVSLRADSAGVVIRGSPEIAINRLQPGHSTTVSWNLCPAQSGNYLLLAHASVAGAGVESQTRLLQVSGQKKRACQ